MHDLEKDKWHQFGMTPVLEEFASENLPSIHHSATPFCDVLFIDGRT
jgi:hypothetical protein